MKRVGTIEPNDPAWKSVSAEIKERLGKLRAALEDPDMLTKSETIGYKHRIQELKDLLKLEKTSKIAPTFDVPD